MKLRLLLLLSLCLSIFSYSQAQSQYKVLLHTGDQILAENVHEYIAQPEMAIDEIVDGFYYRMIQFYELPDITQHQRIEEAGIQLLSYLPHLTYMAAVPVSLDVEQLTDLNVRSILPVDHSFKLALNLRDEIYPDWATFGERVDVILKFYKNLKYDDLQTRMLGDGINILRFNNYNNYIRARVKIDQVQEIANHPYVAFLELGPPPDVADDILGRSLHRAGLLDTGLPNGRNYTGEGVGVLCRDDGPVGPHIDFHGRIDQSFIDPFGFNGSHGDGVSGIMCGAGNLNPNNRGMAAGASLFTLDYEANFLDETMDLFFDHDVIVTNSSYSNGCNAGYTGITATVDQQTHDNPTLMHVFSAGNSNNNECGYGAGDQWGNITGGHKQGKNVIATANLNADASLVNSSSRGPAHDGRIKPDIAANGANQVSTDPDNEYSPFGGTSAAAPGIAGIMAQLHHLYADHNNGERADAALLKAALLNTANDLGNKGPDFKFGWGHVNAYRAGLLLEEERYFKGTVNPNETNTHEIIVPDGTTEIRIMTYWMDPEANVGVSKSLVNNIDTWVVGSTGATFMPWILDDTPDPANLDTPASTGTDFLNNMEQVYIEFPLTAPGTYTLNVQGTELPFGAKEYIVVYQFRDFNIDLVYPNGGEGLVPGEVARIHWDTYTQPNALGGFSLSYAADGVSWQAIQGANLDAEDRMFDWFVPEDFTGEAKIRIQRGAFFAESAEQFTISPTPAGVKVIEGCPESITLTWNEVEGATGYEVYALGEKYMDSIGTTATNIFEYPIANINQDFWFSVAALGENGLKSRRTIAILFEGEITDCVLPNDMKLVSLIAPGNGNISSCDGNLEGQVVVEVANVGINNMNNIQMAYQLDGQGIVTQPLGLSLAAGESSIFTFDTPITFPSEGDYSIAAWVAVPSDDFQGNNQVDADFNISAFTGTGVTLEYQEGFDGGIPGDWTSYNPDNENTWEFGTPVGNGGGFTGALKFDNFDYDLALDDPRTDEIILPDFDLTSVSDSTIFYFDIAYAEREENDQLFSDQFKILVSTDCGYSYPFVVYDKEGDDLSTAPFESTSFSPTGSEWREETINLTPYVGNTVIIKFVNISHNGNNLYLDNINILSVGAPTAIIEASALETCQWDELTFENASTGGQFDEITWDFGELNSPATATGPGPHDVTFINTGMNTVTMTVTNTLGTDETTLEVDVLVLPIAGFTAVDDMGMVTFTNTTTNGITYSWDFGDGNSSEDSDPVHTYVENGVYTVTLTASNGSCTDDFIEEVTVIVVGTGDIEPTFDLQLAPNPNKGLFHMQIESPESDQLTWSLFNLQGQLLLDNTVNILPGRSDFSVDATSFPQGIYFLKVQNEEAFRTVKVVIF